MIIVYCGGTTLTLFNLTSALFFRKLLKGLSATICSSTFLLLSLIVWEWGKTRGGAEGKLRGWAKPKGRKVTLQEVFRGRDSESHAQLDISQLVVSHLTWPILASLITHVDPTITQSEFPWSHRFYTICAT